MITYIKLSKIEGFVFPLHSFLRLQVFSTIKWSNISYKDNKSKVAFALFKLLNKKNKSYIVINLKTSKRHKQISICIATFLYLKH